MSGSNSDSSQYSNLSEDEPDSSSDEDSNDNNSVNGDADFLDKKLSLIGNDESDSHQENSDDDESVDEGIVEDDNNFDLEISTSNQHGLVKNTLKPKGLSGKIAQIDEYENDSSDEEDLRNTIGNIPIEWYDEYSHVGYDVGGKKIFKPKTTDELDEFLNKMEDPYYWRTVKDRQTKQNVILTDVDLDLVSRIRKGRFPDANYDPYQPFIDFFTYNEMIHPVTNRPETKASFIPSISEKRKISRLVSKIKRNERLGLNKPKVKEDRFSFNYDLWTKEDAPSKKNLRHIPAPRQKLPGHASSYNPPPEYLLTKEEEQEWNEEDEEDRKLPFIPQKYEALRKVPGYMNFCKERFERCLDLYLCPRARKLRANVDPEDLIPKLPKPKDLQPFPSILSLTYIGHTDKVCCISVEPRGQFLASGSDDHSLRIWDILTGRCVKMFKFDAPVKTVSWCPHREKCMVVIAVKNEILIINPGIGDKSIVESTDEIFKELCGDDTSTATSKNDIVQWTTVKNDNSNIDWNTGIRIRIRHKFEIKQQAWYNNGDYFSVVLSSCGNQSVVIHQLSKKRSQVPFQKSKGLIECVIFHPSRPFFFVATQRYVRVYNLEKEELTKKLMTNCKHVSSMAIHPGGDNLIIGSFDVRLSWFDLDLSTKPYKTLRYHKKAIRKVAFHSKYPLFASASDDGTIIISHGMVYSDMLQNALIVPVKVLRGHKITDDLGVLDCCFHPQHPWILSSGADSTIRLYTN